MLFSEKMNEAINAQIGNEFGAALQYVSIAAYFDRESLPSMAAHFYTQAEEERLHAMKFVHYVIDAGGTVRIPAVPAPKADFSSAEEAVALSLNWEETVTKQIGALADLAVQESNHMTKVFLDWFITEQLEEVSSMDTLLSIVRRAGPNGLLFVEDYLARQGRLTTTPPAAGA